VRLRHAFKALLPAFHRSGALRLLGLLERGGDLALNYHNVRPAVFARHAEFLAARASVVSLDEMLASPPSSRGRPRVALTFDDGYRSFPREIVPILERHGLPATWFVATALIGTPEVSWLERLRLAVLWSTRERIDLGGRRFELRAWNRAYIASALCSEVKGLPPEAQRETALSLISRMGEAPAEVVASLAMATPDQFPGLPATVTVGSHSHTHPQLPQHTDPEIREELRTSRGLLEQWWGRPVVHFAFPSGDQDERVRGLVRAEGFASAWTTESRFRTARDEAFRMPRVAIDDEAAVAVLATRLTPFVYRLGVV
jgi:peptidoglycan/xylan/chitin deacetylase (PgdA/CDA1 family)